MAQKRNEEKKSIADWINSWGRAVLTGSAVIVLLGTMFAGKFVEPVVDKRVAPLEGAINQNTKAIQYQNFMFMELLPDSSMDRVNKRWKMHEQASGRE